MSEIPNSCGECEQCSEWGSCRASENDMRVDPHTKTRNINCPLEEKDRADK